MKISYKRLKDGFSRVTGIDTPFGGVSWESKDSERTIAKRVIGFLEDRRILFVQHNWECRDECIGSAHKMREYFTTQLESLDREGDLAQRISIMRKACRDFLNAIRDIEISDPKNDFNFVPEGRPRQSLENLRSVFGQHIYWLVIDYELEIEEELASAFPEYLSK